MTYSNQKSCFYTYGYPKDVPFESQLGRLLNGLSNVECKCCKCSDKDKQTNIGDKVCSDSDDDVKQDDNTTTNNQDDKTTCDVPFDGGVIDFTPNDNDGQCTVPSQDCLDDKKTDKSKFTFHYQSLYDDMTCPTP